MYLEQYLLSLYRKAFDQQLPSVAPFTKEEKVKSPPSTPRARFVEVSKPEVLTKRGSSAVQSIDHELDTMQKEYNGYEPETLGKEYNVHQPEGKRLDSSVYRCHSSLSQCTTFTTRVSAPAAEVLTESLRTCHSQPLSMMEVNHVSWEFSFTCFVFSMAPSTLSCCNHTDRSCLGYSNLCLSFWKNTRQYSFYCEVLFCTFLFVNILVLIPENNLFGCLLWILTQLNLCYAVCPKC